MSSETDNTASFPPRRGKFLAPPPATAAPVSVPAKLSLASPPGTAPAGSGGRAVVAPGGSRGKFIGETRPVASPLPAGPQGAANAGGSSGAPLSSKALLESPMRTRIHAAKIEAVSRRKAVGQRRDRVFRDLDEAEDIVLSLLMCAADAAEALSDMATAESRAVPGSDEGRIRAKEKRKQSFEELAARVRANSAGYLTGAKKLHSLLVPHASLVKAYRNHDDETSEVNKKGSGGQLTFTGVKDVAKNTSVGVASSPSRGIVAGAETSNMYAARVEKRLAMERSGILKEMIRLEESETRHNVVEDDATRNDKNRITGEIGTGTDTAGTKRKQNETE